jgi:hypothetical protein
MAMGMGRLPEAGLRAAPEWRGQAAWPTALTAPVAAQA